MVERGCEYCSGSSNVGTELVEKQGELLRALKLWGRDKFRNIEKEVEKRKKRLREVEEQGG